MTIKTIETSQYVELIEVWEASVRATHDFLPESDVLQLKPLILNSYFKAVTLRGWFVNDKPVAFMGVDERAIEMLFVAPQYFGKGIGSKLLSYALKHFDVYKVDVNEQNPKALGFYQHHGFKVVGRSERDGQDNPYPILHLAMTLEA